MFDYGMNTKPQGFQPSQQPPPTRPSTGGYGDVWKGPISNNFNIPDGRMDEFGYFKRKFPQNPNPNATFNPNANVPNPYQNFSTSGILQQLMQRGLR